tara:strand:+ start:5784 stop:6383 length:600 start_codon:yes stop_codon:yes gene_type:complete
MRQEVADIVEKIQNSSGPMERINSYDIEQAIIAEYGEEKEGRHHCETCNVWVKSLKDHAKRSTEHIARLEIDDLTEGGWYNVTAYRILQNISAVYRDREDLQRPDSGFAIAGFVADLGTDISRVGPVMSNYSNRVKHGELYMKVAEKGLEEIIEYIRHTLKIGDRWAHLPVSARAELVHRVRDYAGDGDEFTIMKLGTL